MSVRVDIGETTGCVVTITGDADLYAAANVERQLDQLIHDGQKTIVVDLTGATFVDSTMLRVLLKASKRLRSATGELIVVCTGPNIPKIFEVTLLNRVFTMFEKLEEALAYASSPARRTPERLLR